MRSKLNCILLIDDDEPTTFLCKMLIEEANCTEHIEVAHTGREALNYLTNSNHPRPDLIFLDLNMPAMNGWEFLEKYKKLQKESKGKIVVVMLSTSLNPDDKIQANEMPDVAGYESKPLTAEKLDAILDRYFRHAASAV